MIGFEAACEALELGSVDMAVVEHDRAYPYGKE